jgi:hypothetical protein
MNYNCGQRAKGEREMPRQKMLLRLLTGTFLAGVFWAAVSLQGEEPKDSPVAATGAKPKSGKVTGIITAKSDKDIKFKPEGAKEPQRYLLAAPADGAPSAEMQAAMKKVFVTNLVVLEWVGEEDPVVRSIHSIHAKNRSGVTSGTVVAVEPTGDPPHFDVKPSGLGFTERYQPHYDPAAKRWEEKPASVIAKLKVGDKVKVTWVYDERKHPKDIQVTGHAKETPAPEKGKK